jgi:mannose-6-phosphate isomerase-like protein (cupin superfamily)
MIMRFALAAALLAGFAASPAVAFDPIVSLADEHLTVEPIGNVHQVLATREQTGGQLGIIILGDSEAGSGPGPAITPAREAEYWYVLEGTYEFHIGDKVVEGGPGTFVAVAAGEPHGYIAKTAGKLLAIFSPGGYEHFFMDWAGMALERGPELGKLENSYGVTRPPRP